MGSCDEIIIGSGWMCGTGWTRTLHRRPDKVSAGEDQSRDLKLTRGFKDIPRADYIGGQDFIPTGCHTWVTGRFTIPSNGLNYWIT